MPNSGVAVVAVAVVVFSSQDPSAERVGTKTQSGTGRVVGEDVVGTVVEEGIDIGGRSREDVILLSMIAVAIGEFPTRIR